MNNWQSQGHRSAACRRLTPSIATPIPHTTTSEAARQRSIGYGRSTPEVKTMAKGTHALHPHCVRCSTDLAYWLYLQAYFESQLEFNLSQVAGTATVHLPKKNIVDQGAIRKFAQYKERVLSQLQGVIRHDA
jgi:hypothetical protein